jgi:sporulation protein YlmC with PRC-barrel domain
MLSGIRRAASKAIGIDSKRGSSLLGSKNLVGDDVYDAEGRRLGVVEEIVLDARTGCVRYVVLTLGGFIGIGHKRVAVPWSALTADAGYRRCVLDVVLMRLTAMPVVDDDRWLELNDPAWVTKARSYGFERLWG